MFFASQKMVLNTRPMGQQDRLNQLLMFYGLQGLHFPLLEIAPLSALPLLPEQHWDVALFTSSNAVQYCLHQYKTLPKADQYLCIGMATNDTLKELTKLEGSYPDIPDSEAMLAMPALADCSGKRIALISGLGGRDLLENTIRARGALLHRFDVYERRMPNYPPEKVVQALEQCASIVITSGDSLKNLLKLTPVAHQNLLRSRLLATISPRIQDIALRLGFNDVIVGELADIPQKIKNHLQGRHYD